MHVYKKNPQSIYVITIIHKYYTGEGYTKLRDHVKRSPFTIAKSALILKNTYFEYLAGLRVFRIFE